jgi:nitrogen-specific signal transduction histidine kinase/CheY-like chemotaxis protein
MFEGLAIDITARKHAEADKIAIERKLLEGQKLESLGLLAGGIAHDFNNLLTGIMGHANLARFIPGIGEEVMEHLAKIETGSERAAELCQQMLAYSGQGHFAVEPIDLNVLVRDILPLLKGSLPSRAHVELCLMPEPAMVIGDATQFRQIAMNLVLNASDALGAAGGEIKVTSCRRSLDRQFFVGARVGETLPEGEYVLLEFSDTGCGMPPETLAKIFDPFFTTKFTGRGLGLAAVLGIVRGHGGALFVESEIGQGTTFTLVLPPCAEPPASTPAGESLAPWQHSGRVLVIDDEAPVREVAAELIRTFGFTVDTAAGGLEAIERVKESPTSFDVVFLDLTMPELDGIETLTRLRAINPAIRVLLVSGYSEGDSVAKLAQEGPVLFIQKPFTRSGLEQKLRSILA